MKLSQTIARTRAKKNVRGQGMSEYLIIVALIAVAGIAVMGLFGGAARNQVAGLANELSGGSAAESKTIIDQSQADANAAQADAAIGVGLSNYGGGKQVISGGARVAGAEND